MVFIQDLIAGVTGESVARHIQMLLGSGAPTFVFMHDGNSKAKPVKGLYDYLIDLSKDDTKVVADVQSILKLLLGPQWHKIFVSPAVDKPVVKATLTVPDERRGSANQLVDDFISDLTVAGPAPIKTSTSPIDCVAPDICPEEPFTFVSSHQDQLADIVSETAREQQRIETKAIDTRDVISEKIVSPSELKSLPVQANQPVFSPENRGTDARKPAVVSGRRSSITEDSPSVSTQQAPSVPTNRGVFGNLPYPSVSPANFKIVRDEVVADESLPGLRGHSNSKEITRKWTQGVAVLLVLCLIGGVWYLVTQKPHLLHFAPRESSPATVLIPTIQPMTQVLAVQKNTSTSQRKEQAALPSFISLAGHDSQFASQKPGWERYVGTDSEYRVFRSAGKLKAVQVLATNNNVISESRLKKILTELTGTGEYRITSREQKRDFQLLRATVNRNADLLIYKRKIGVHAFVVSL
jgi:hypothetical protein